MDEFGGVLGQPASSRSAGPNFGKIDNRHFVQQIDGLQELNPEDQKQSSKFIGQPAGQTFSRKWPIFLWQQVTDVRRLEAVEVTQGVSGRVMAGEDSLWIP